MKLKLSTQISVLNSQIRAILLHLVFPISFLVLTPVLSPPKVVPFESANLKKSNSFFRFKNTRFDY